MPDHRTLTHVDTLRLAVKQPFNFRYTLWKPSHFATGLEQHSRNTSWRTFRVGELLTGVVMAWRTPTPSGRGLRRWGLAGG